MRKNIVSIFFVSALSMSLVAAQAALGDASTAGTYDQSTTSSSDQQSGVASEHPESLDSSDQQAGISGSDEMSQSAGVYDSGDQSTLGQQPGATDTMAPVTTAEAEDMDLTGLQKEAISIQPQVGAINYRDVGGATDNRMTYGFTANMNLPYLAKNRDVYLGPQVGFFYSHLGAQNANFLGSSPGNSVGDAGANMFYVPTDIKLGVNLGSFRPSVHAGANLFYSSTASSIALGRNPDSGPQSDWSYLPNLGLDLEYAFADNIGVVARPDVTFAGSNRIWTASIGATSPLG